MLKFAASLVALSTLVHLVAYLLPQAMPEHLLDHAWPDHARFHMWQATFWIASLDLVMLGLALGPFRLGQRWAFWALLMGTAGAQLGYFFSAIIVPEGMPPVAGANLGLGIVMLPALVGLTLGWKHTA